MAHNILNYLYMLYAYTVFFYSKILLSYGDGDYFIRIDLFVAGIKFCWLSS